MTRLFFGDQTGNLHYELGSDSLPGARTDYIVFGNREYYQCRGYAEVTATPGSQIPCFLSGQMVDTKSPMVLPPGAVVFSSRLAMPPDVVLGNGTDAGTTYAHWQTVTLGTDTFVPRVSGTVSGTSVNFGINQVAASGSATNFHTPLPALTAPRQVNIYNSGSTGIRCLAKDAPTQIGVEVEFSLPYGARNIAREEIVIL